jgi:uncharacterized Zn finger protein
MIFNLPITLSCYKCMSPNLIEFSHNLFSDRILNPLYKCEDCGSVQEVELPHMKRFSQTY